MIKLVRRIITSICLLGITYANAQTTFYLDGLGRAQVANDGLSGDVLASDTVGDKQLDRKNTGGYTLLDLGINLEKKEKFYLNAILRGRNPFGLFWGEGTTFEFRKITMGGIIGSGINYEMGDIYVEMSPYTVYMPDLEYNKYEADYFALRRGIVGYENFINGNKRFLQGVKSDGTLLFTKGIQKLYLGGFATRTSEITQLGSPDILMTGLNGKAIQGKYGSAGLNFVSIFDLPVATNTEEYNATTFTTSLNPSYEVNEKLKLGIDAELGGSNYTYKTTVQDDNIAFSGFMLDVKAKAELKKLKTTVTAGFKNVDPAFRAPGAQTRRIQYGQTAQVFPNSGVDKINDTTFALTSRTPLLYDRFTQENMYKQGISRRLEGFNPAFNNVNPYGDATPNRTGLVASVARGDKNDAFSLDAKVQLLSEIEGDITSGTELRKFTSIASGLLVNVSKIAEFKNDLFVSLGYQSENTTRAGNEKIDLASSILDGSITYEFVKDVDLMLGYKYFVAKGNEYLFQYSASNYVKNFIDEYAVDAKQSMLTFGGRFRFTEKSAVTLNYSIIDAKNALTSEKDDYKWNQLFVNYTMKF